MGAAEGLVAVADHQTAGRGRLDRAWESPAGGVNLLCSVLLRPAPPAVRQLSSVRVALAGRDAAADVTGGAIVAGLKWPNDLVVDDRKLAGVLAEAVDDAVVVGIGMNIAWAPEGAAALGLPATRDAVLDALLRSLSGWVEAGDDAVAAAYRAACVTLGRRVRVDLAGDRGGVTGQAVDVTADGRLLLAPEGGGEPVTIDVGDVVHLR